MSRKAAFVLAACDDGPMILSCRDYALDMMTGKLTLGVGQTLLETGSHAQHSLDMLIQLAQVRRQRRDDKVVAFDIGANIGSFTVGWAKAMDGWGEVLAFEAQERVFYALAGNLALNNVFNARAIWAAVSDVGGGLLPMQEVDYQEPAHVSGISLRSEYNGEVGQRTRVGAPVRTLRIDDMDLAHVDIIKIDVEGMEPQVLRGATQTMQRDRPYLFCEWIFSKPEILFELMPSNYRFVVMAGDMLAMPEDDPVWDRIKIKAAA